MFFAVVECPGKSLTIVFVKGKWLNVVTPVIGFYKMCERIPDAVFRKKIQNVIGCVISAHQKELKLHGLK